LKFGDPSELVAGVAPVAVGSAGGLSVKMVKGSVLLLELALDVLVESASVDDSCVGDVSI